MVSEGGSAPLTPDPRAQQVTSARRPRRASVELVDVSHVTPVTGEQDIVVALARTDHVEGDRGHEGHVESSAARSSVSGGWGRGMERVPEVDRYVTGFR
jgi:hypothetical protein